MQDVKSYLKSGIVYRSRSSLFKYLSCFLILTEFLFLKKGEKMFIELARKRRSIRKFTSQQVEQEKVDAIIEAALRAPSGRAAKLEFVVVKDKALLEKLSIAKPSGAAFVKDASVGIVVCGDPSESHLWIVNCSIAAVSMQYAAHSMGLGSRWTQMRGNNYDDSKSSRDYIAELLDLPDNLDVECIIAIGYPGEDMVPYRKEDLDFDKVSYNRYGLKTD
jgi:nitroreductase